MRTILAGTEYFADARYGTNERHGSGTSYVPSQRFISMAGRPSGTLFFQDRMRTARAAALR
jgi:hypothetical protein